MKVIIVGGTGFLGYHGALEFLKRGHEVDTVALRDIELGDWFPHNIGVKYANVFTMEKDELIALFRGYDIMVYAVGPDDRITPPAPSYDFFYERLVNACGRVVDGAKEAGVKRCIISNSYFAYFNRIYPQLKLAERHPYIKCRVEQADRCLKAGKDGFDVIILELPYIFGTMPDRVPLWKEVFLSRIEKMGRFIFFYKGGTVMMTVNQVAQCIVGAAEKGEAGRRYPCGSVNVDWNTWLSWIQEALDTNKRVVHLPAFLCSLYGMIERFKERRKGRQGGLNYKYLFKDIQCRHLYYDDFQTNQELGIRVDNIKKSVIETMKACL